jgi:hypothetical protein
MRKIIGAIFGSKKNTETIVDGAVSGLDKMFFTKEEKAEHQAKMGDWFLKYLEATQPQNIARRLIAVIIVMLWAFLILCGVAIYRFDQAYSQFIFDILADVVMNPFLMVMGFYFAAHVLRSYQSQKK